MQEETINWDPIYMNHPLSWTTRVLVFWLLFCIAASIYKLVRVAMQMRALRKASKGTVAETKALDVWDPCRIRLQSVERMITFTFLLTMFATAHDITNILRNAAASGAIGIGPLCGGLAESFSVCGIGLFVCVGLYAVVALQQGKLAKESRVEM